MTKSVKQLELLPAQTLDDALRDLRWREFDVVPAWLQQHTASAALLLCIGSGPWKIHRRQKVQNDFLQELRATPNREITEISIDAIAFPLEWQKRMFGQARRFAIEQADTFNNIFDQRRNSKSRGVDFIRCFGDVDTVPKVLGMFARDYICVDNVFPIDRHVRDWLRDRKLPQQYSKIVPLLQQAGATPAAVSRAIFGKHSHNPQHAATL